MQQENEERAINLIKIGIYRLHNCSGNVFEFKSKEELKKFLNYYSTFLPKKLKKGLSFPVKINLRVDWNYNWEIEKVENTNTDYINKDPIEYIDLVENVYISVIRKHGRRILENINKKVYVSRKETLIKDAVKFLGLEPSPIKTGFIYVIGSVIKDLVYYCNSRNSIKVGEYYKTIEGYDLKKVEKILTFLGFDVLGFGKQSRIFTLEDGCIEGVSCISKFINAEPKDITVEIEMLGSKFFPETWEKTDIQELAKKERENSEKKEFEGLREKYYEVLDNLKTSKEYRKQVRNFIIERLGPVVRVMEVINYSSVTSPTVTILEEIGYVHTPCNNLLIMSLPFERDINKVEITGITPEGQIKLLTDIYNLCEREKVETELTHISCTTNEENTPNYFKVMDLLKIDLGSREKVREIIDGCTGIFSSGNIIKITGEGKYVNILQEILQELKLHIAKTPSEIVVSNPINPINNVNVSIYNESAKHIYEEISKELIKNN